MNCVRDKIQNQFNKPIHMTTQTIDPAVPRPYFRLMVQSFSQKPLIGNRCQYRYPFSIEYYPEASESELTVHDMAKQLTEMLTILESGELKVRGTGMNYELQEGILYFYVNYSLYEVKPASSQTESMGSISIKSNSKG